MNEKKNKKLGILLIITGVVVILITLGGFYLSQNPRIISEWQYKRDSARKDALRDILLTASDDCLEAKVAMFDRACALMEREDYDERINRIWNEGMTAKEESCAVTSFRDTTLFKLEYNGDPKSHIEHMENGESINLHLCGVVEDLKFYHPNFKATNAKELIDRWHSWKHSEGNYYH